MFMHPESLNMCITIDPKRTFFLLLKVVLVLIGIFVASLLIVFIIQGGEEYKGFFYLVFIVISLILVFRIYLKNIKTPSKMEQALEPELYGNLESAAAMVQRASKGYEYSREKLEQMLSEIRGKEYHFSGSGSQYLEMVRKALEEI